MFIFYWERQNLEKYQILPKCLVAINYHQNTALLNWRMIFGGRDVPWNVSTRILNVCKIIFIPKISNAQNTKPN
jgi:hypothetical protein